MRALLAALAAVGRLSGRVGDVRAAVVLRHVPGRRAPLDRRAAALQRAPRHRRRRVLPRLRAAVRLGGVAARPRAGRPRVPRVRAVLGAPPRLARDAPRRPQHVRRRRPDGLAGRRARRGARRRGPRPRTLSSDAAHRAHTPGGDRRGVAAPARAGPDPPLVRLGLRGPRPRDRRDLHAGGGGRRARPRARLGRAARRAATGSSWPTPARRRSCASTTSRPTASTRVAEGWISFAHQLRFALEHEGERRTLRLTGGRPRDDQPGEPYFQTEHQTATVVDGALLLVAEGGDGTAAMTLSVYGASPTRPAGAPGGAAERYRQKKKSPSPAALSVSTRGAPGGRAPG